MGNYNVTITNEGAALLASVIANQGTITFTEARLSSTNYVGQEQTLTEGTFGGTFLTTTVWASVVSVYPNQIRLQTKFSTDWISAPYDMYSVGIIGTDGNTTALVCVLTTSNPDRVEPSDGMGNYYNFRTILTVSSTSDITVVGTTAAVLYDTDIVDNLTTADATKVLSANMGVAIADNLAANEESGAKNILSYPYEETTKTENGVTFTDNGDGTISVVASSGATADTYFGLHYPYKPLYVEKGTYILSGCPMGGSESTYFLSSSLANDTGAGATFVESSGDNRLFLIVIKSGTVISTPITFKPMLCDARILDPTFAPFAKTNLQLTNDVASIFDILPNNAGAHNRYRGKALTIDANFWAHISDGTFENQFVGDTITINGRTYTLAHANYWLHTGDFECGANHWAVISPNMGNAKMNSDDSTAGGYLGSGFRSGINHDSTPNTALADAIATIKSDFGASHIMSYREYLDNAVTGGYPSAGAWVTSEAELMSQIMVYGNRFFDPSTNLGATIPALYSIEKSQLALYAQRPDLLTDRSTWWLRDVMSAAIFANVGAYGTADYYGASASFGVRLAFGIIA